MSDPLQRRTGSLGASMRAVWYERTGPADAVLAVGEKPTPVAGSGEAVSYTHLDVYKRQGLSFYQILELLNLFFERSLGSSRRCRVADFLPYVQR